MPPESQVNVYPLPTYNNTEVEQKPKMVMWSCGRHSRKRWMLMALRKLFSSKNATTTSISCISLENRERKNVFKFLISFKRVFSPVFQTVLPVSIYFKIRSFIRLYQCKKPFRNTRRLNPSSNFSR